MYYEAHVILRFDSERVLNLDDVRNFLHGQPQAVKPCEMVFVQDVEDADWSASWVQQWEMMKQQNKILNLLEDTIAGNCTRR